jgi:tetratricopeptide (TPR) repeat protein
MEDPDVLKRVSDLEREVEALRASLKVEQTASTSRFQKLARWLIANWVLVSFLAALTTATYVKFRFGVDYLENYRTLSTTKGLSEFYREMGDRLMISAEWDAAEQAYRVALQVNPNNTRATYGIAKAQVFQPLPGQKYYAPEVVDAKLDYLQSRFPDDHEIYFLKSIRYQDQGDLEKAKLWLRKCIEKNPKYVGCYLNLGYINQRLYEVSEAVSNFSKALDLDPNSATAKNNLGFCQLLLSDYTEAIRQLKEAYVISPNMLTAVNLGDAYRYSGDLSDALAWHRLALDGLNEMKTPGDEERYIRGIWLYSFMPLSAGDQQTIKYSIQVYNRRQKEALAHYALCIDLALSGNFDGSTKEFDTGLTLERSLPFREFFQNKMLSVENLVQPRADAKAWLDQHRNMLN